MFWQSLKLLICPASTIDSYRTAFSFVGRGNNHTRECCLACSLISQDNNRIILVGKDSGEIIFFLLTLINFNFYFHDFCFNYYVFIMTVHHTYERHLTEAAMFRFVKQELELYIRKRLPVSSSILLLTRKVVL